MFAIAIALLASAPEVAASVEAQPTHRLELQVTPVSVQMNGLDREHMGTLARATWRIHRLFGVFVGGGYNWFNQPSGEQDIFRAEVERIDVGRPSPAQMTWSAFAGVESIPLSGDLQIGTVISGRFGLSIAAGVGPAGMRHRLKPLTVRTGGSTNPATWGFGNVRPAGHAAIAWRFEFGAFAASLGVRGTMWSDATTTVNDCNIDDLRAMDQQIRRGEPHTSAAVRPGCFITEQNDVPLAVNVVRTPNDTLTVNLAGEFALSWSFF